MYWSRANVDLITLLTFALLLSCALPGVAAELEAGRPSETAVVSFELDVMPILTARGCNAGACHGKARGQNGFQLSLLGFDPDFDHAALTQEARGRRIFVSAPEHSLLLRKASAEVPHGGGERLRKDGADYNVLRNWIAQGATRRLAGEPRLETITMTPSAQAMRPQEQQQLRIIAYYSDGTERDVTGRSAFQSNESAVVDVDDTGLVTAGSLPGEATLMGRYMSHIATCLVTIPLAGEVPPSSYEQLPRHNFVDELVWKKLETLGITPSAPADDAMFLRRAHVDIIGRLPTPDEVRSFLADTDPNKRAALIDRLLDRPEYADHWSNKWADLLRPNPYRVGIKAVLNYDHWIRDSFRKNKPYDQLVRELITAQGSTWHNGAATLFRDRRSPDEVATIVSQLFLGIRLECARCHHHPFEKWSQEDFYSFAAYFARVGYKGSGLSPPISGGEEMIHISDKGSVQHPVTGETLDPRPLFGEVPPSGKEDPRAALAEWILSDGEAYFSQVMANRVWAEMMGRGLVDPVDDLRATNPPSNPALLEKLAEHFRASGYDIQELIRTIANSYVYGLSSEPAERNVGDTRNYSRHYRQRLSAEVLADAVADVTGVTDRFSASPPGTRASQLWTRRIDSTFLDTFGRPDANQDPPCERLNEATVTQTLHLMNSPRLHEKITADDGRAAELAGSDLSPEEIVEELYLLVYGRLPDEVERQNAAALFQQRPVDNRRLATEDLLWALLNTPEFVFEN